MGKVKLVRLSLPKSERRKMSATEKKRYIMFAFILRDLNLIQKCLIYSRNDTPAVQLLDSANTTASVFFMKTLISKIHEMRKFMEKNKVVTDTATYSPELKDSVKRIDDFYSDSKVRNIFAFVRDKMGFHYEHKKDIDALIETVFDSFDDNEFSMWLSETDSGNDIFVSATTLTMSVILKQMQIEGFQGDDLTRMEKLFTLSLGAARLFQNFSSLYLAEAFNVQWNQDESIEVDVPVISTVTLPVIVAKE